MRPRSRSGSRLPGVRFRRLHRVADRDRKDRLSQGALHRAPLVLPPSPPGHVLRHGRRRRTGLAPPGAESLSPQSPHPRTARSPRPEVGAHLGCSLVRHGGRIVATPCDIPPGDEPMDDQGVTYSHDASYWVGAVVLGLVLAGVAWLLASLSTGTGGGRVQVRGSDRQVSRSLSAPHRLPDQTQRCIDAAAARGVPVCTATSFAPSARATPSDRRAQRSTHQVAVVVTPPPTPGPAPSAPASIQPATLQPSTPPSSTPPSSTPPPATPTRRSLPHNGPVPGGNTSPPHTGPRP